MKTKCFFLVISLFLFLFTPIIAQAQTCPSSKEELVKQLDEKRNRIRELKQQIEDAKRKQKENTGEGKDDVNSNHILLKAVYYSRLAVSGPEKDRIKNNAKAQEYLSGVPKGKLPSDPRLTNNILREVNKSKPSKKDRKESLKELQCFLNEEMNQLEKLKSCAKDMDEIERITKAMKEADDMLNELNKALADLDKEKEMSKQKDTPQIQQVGRQWKPSESQPHKQSNQ